MVVDTASPVDKVNVVAILRRPPDVEVRKLEVVQENSAPWQLELGCDGAISHELPDGRPHTIMAIIMRDQRKAVQDATVAHQSEDIVADWFEDIGIVVQSQDVL